MTAQVSLADWRQITARAVQDAKSGDNQARTWLSKHLVGDDPLALVVLVEELRVALGEIRHYEAQLASSGPTAVSGGPRAPAGVASVPGATAAG
jgi:hypothetical protein